MSIYTGTANGSVQANVYDQPASALPGQLYSATETTLVDGVAVNEAAGIGVGIGVVTSYSTTASYPGINNKLAALPVVGKTAADFGGVLVRNAAGQTDSNGVVYVGYKRMADILRPTRAGGRIWVKANNAVTAAGGAPYWIIQDTASHGFPIGSFSYTALGAAGIDTVQLTNAVWASTATAGNPALIELG